jgi:hypothetical protein
MMKLKRMGWEGECRMNAGGEECMQVIGGKPRRKKTTRKTKA